MYKILSIAILLSFFSCKTNSQKVDKAPMEKEQTITQRTSEVNDPTNSIEKVIKSAKEWKAQLSEKEYYVLREEGTERPFTSDLLEEKRKGTFICKGCGLELFASETKFKSGTGWPSFYEPLAPANIGEDTDHKLGYARTEVECGRCGGHLGHVFNDGPKPTGLRYCINGVCLDFKPAE